MKTILTILFLTLITSSNIKAQTLINGSFDSLCICAIDRIYDWGTSDVIMFQNNTVVPFAADQDISATYDIRFSMFTTEFNYDNSDTDHVLSSIILPTFPSKHYPNGDVFRSFIVNGKKMYADTDGYVDFSKSGEPFAASVSVIIGFSGEYKFQNFTGNSTDYGKIKFLLKKYNSITQSIDTIAYGESTTELRDTNQWAHFTIPFSFNSGGVSDSVVVIVESSSLNLGTDSSVLWIDNLEFEFNTISVEEHNITDQVKVYPNPTSGQVTIETNPEEDRTYEVINSQGQVVKKMTENQTIDISDQPNGLYYINPQGEKSKRGIKVLKN